MTDRNDAHDTPPILQQQQQQHDENGDQRSGNPDIAQHTGEQMQEQPHRQHQQQAQLPAPDADHSGHGAERNASSRRQHARVVYIRRIAMPVCAVPCQSAITLDLVARHLRQTHGWSAEESKVVHDEMHEAHAAIDEPAVQGEQRLDRERAQLTGESLLQPVPHLRVQVGFACASCPFATARMQMLTQHREQNGHTPVQATTFVQTLQRGNRTRWFRVATQRANQSAADLAFGDVLWPTTDGEDKNNNNNNNNNNNYNNNDDDKEQDHDRDHDGDKNKDKDKAFTAGMNDDEKALFQALRSDMNMSEGSSTARDSADPDSVNRHSPLLYEMRFDAQLHAHGISLEQAFALCRWGSESNEVKNMAKRYMEASQSYVKARPYVSRHPFLDTSLSIAVSSKSVGTYAGRIASLLCFVRRLQTLRADLVPDKQLVFALDRLARNRSTASSEAGASIPQALSSLHDVLLVLLYTPFDDTEDTTPALVQLFLASAAVVSDARQADPSGPLLEDLQHADVDVNDGACNIDRPDSPAGVQGSNAAATTATTPTTLRFALAHEMTPLLAAIKFIARCFVVHHVYIRQTGIEDDKARRWKFIENNLTAHVDNGIMYTVYVLRTCNTLRASGDPVNLRFTPCTQHPACGYVEALHVDTKRLARVVSKIQRDATRLLYDRLLNGLNVGARFWKRAAQLQDSLRDQTPGYWFGSHPANVELARECRDHAFAALVRSRSVRSHGTEHESIELECKSTRQFLDDCDALMRALLTLLQLTSGSPARMTELATVTVNNRAGGARSVYIINSKYIAFLVRYHKGQRLNNGQPKPIARVPDTTTSRLFIVYLLFVRPVELAVRRRFYAKSSDALAEQAQSSLFLHTSGPATGDLMRTWFRTTMRHAGLELNVHQYRHLHAGLIKHCLGGDNAARLRALSSAVDNALDAEDTDLTAALHLQAGHSVRTAETVYGIGDNDMRTLTTSTLLRYNAASEAWHRVLGLSSGLTPSPSVNDDNPTHLADHSNDNDVTIVATRPVDNSPPTDVAQAMHAMSTQLGKVIGQLANNTNLLQLVLREHRKRSDGPAQPGATRALAQHASADQYNADVDNSVNKHNNEQSNIDDKHKEDELNNRLTDALRAVLRNPSAQFRNDDLRRAVTQSAKRACDLLVIQPTGAGKSMTFVLPALIDATRTSLLVVPLLALQHDILARCQVAGVDAVLWPERHNASPRLVILSAEHVLSSDYVHFLTHLQANATLGSIYIDEAHLLPLWANFRPVMADLATAVRPHDVTCRVIALTATCPPDLQPALCTMAGLRNPTIMRSPTSRANIAYNWLAVPSDQTASATIGLVCDELQKHNKSSQTRIIVYAPTRAQTMELQSILDKVIRYATFLCYHAGQPLSDRRKCYNDFLRASDKPIVVVATSAFGCGLDCGDVRSVIHTGAPATLIDYVQESGRAGRDGKPATSYLLHDGGGIAWQRDANSSNKSDNTAARDPCDIPQPTFERVPSPSKISSPNAHCRRLHIDKAMDGTVSPSTCANRGPDWAWCDICRAAPYKVAEKKRPLPPSTPPPRNVARRLCYDTAPDHSPATPATCSGMGPEPRAQSASASPNTPTLSPGLAHTQHSTRSFSTQHSLPADINTLCDRFHNVCAPCTLRDKREISHGGESKECYKRKCLRCGTGEHSFSSCILVQLIQRAGNCCFQCGIGRHHGVFLHDQAEYGKRNCRKINSLRLAVLAWERSAERADMKRNIPELADVDTLKDYLCFLTGIATRGNNGPERAGLGTVLKWFSDCYLV